MQFKPGFYANRMYTVCHTVACSSSQNIYCHVPFELHKFLSLFPWIVIALQRHFWTSADIYLTHTAPKTKTLQCQTKFSSVYRKVQFEHRQVDFQENFENFPYKCTWGPITVVFTFLPSLKKPYHISCKQLYGIFVWC